MITYLCHQHHTYTLADWLAQHATEQRGEIRILPYQHVRGFLDPGVYVFSDIERLDPALTAKALRLYERLDAAGSILLNHPTRSQKRYALQKVLENDFSVYRQGEVSRPR